MGCGCLLSQQQLNSKTLNINKLSKAIQEFESKIEDGKKDSANKKTINSQLKKNEALAALRHTQSLKQRTTSLSQTQKLKNKLEQLQKNKTTIIDLNKSLQMSIKKSQDQLKLIQLEINKIEGYIRDHDKNIEIDEQAIKMRQQNIAQLKNIIISKTTQKANLQLEVKNLKSKKKDNQILEAGLRNLQIAKREDQAKLDFFEKNKMTTYLNVNQNEIKIELLKKSVMQLKRIVLQDYWKQYRESQIVLSFNGTQLQQYQDIPETDEKKQIVVRKAEVWEIQGISSNKYKFDEISNTKGIAYTKQCFHHFSRQTMLGIINFQIKIQKMNEIRCTFYSSQHSKCNRVLDANFCMLVAGLSIKESEKLSYQMSANWALKNCKKCPFCLSMLTNINQNANKVSCIFCKTSFCPKCQKNWKSNYRTFCMSKECMQSYDQNKIMLINAPKTRVFQLRFKHSQEKHNIYVPNMRACPRCNRLIMNTSLCKHTPCPCTTDQTYSFCFVCLSLPVKGKWSCGDSFEYCGRVAPNG